MTIHELATPSNCRCVEMVARVQIKRRRRLYDALALFEYEDLAQEIWLEMTGMYNDGLPLSVFSRDPGEFGYFVQSVAEKVAERAKSQRRSGFVEVVFSELEASEKKAYKALCRRG